MGRLGNKGIILSWIGAFAGALLYVLSYKLFIIPLGLYIGGYPGIAQIISDLITDALHIELSFDLTGIILWIANIPMFLLARKIVNRQFLIKIIATVLVMSTAVSLLPASASLFIQDTLTASVVGGALSGLGVGIMLRNGSCGGGIDILGLYYAKKYPAFSVGKIAILINIVVYSYSAWRENLTVAVYSMIFAIVAALVTDKLHYQNIETCAVIISKVAGIERPIIEKMGRGVTLWKGYGGFHMEDSFIYLTMISKYEIHYLEYLVKTLDPVAFIILDENHHTIGNFEKRFDI